MATQHQAITKIINRDKIGEEAEVWRVKLHQKLDLS